MIGLYSVGVYFGVGLVLIVGVEIVVCVLVGDVVMLLIGVLCGW